MKHFRVLERTSLFAHFTDVNTEKPEFMFENSSSYWDPAEVLTALSFPSHSMKMHDLGRFYIDLKFIFCLYLGLFAYLVLML